MGKNIFLGLHRQVVTLSRPLYTSLVQLGPGVAAMMRRRLSLTVMIIDCSSSPPFMWERTWVQASRENFPQLWDKIWEWPGDEARLDFMNHVLVSLPSEFSVILANTYGDRCVHMKMKIENTNITFIFTVSSHVHTVIILQSAHLPSLIPRLLGGVLGMRLQDMHRN